MLDYFVPVLLFSYLSFYSHILLHDRIIDIDDKTVKGIDGIFEKDGKYFIVESKCCQGTNNKLKLKLKLEQLADGSYQMDATWIENRIKSSSLPKSVQDKILDNYVPVLARATESGTLTYSKIVHVAGKRPSIPRGKAARVTEINGG